MTERDTRKRVVGFLGYSGFDSPIEIAYKLMTGRNQVIRKLGNQKEGTDLPTYSELVHEASVGTFMETFSYDTLSPAALDKAKKIPQALLEPISYGAAAGHRDTTPVIPESDLIDGLVLFLWATAKGPNSTVPSFSPKAWSKDALKEFAYLKATFQGDDLSDGEDEVKSLDSSEGEDTSSNSDRARTTGAATAGARTAGGDSGARTAGDSGITARTAGGGGSGTPTNLSGANVSGSKRPRQSGDPGDPNDPDSEEDSQSSELSLREQSAARKRNRKKRKKKMQAASGSPVISKPIAMHLEMLNASVRSMAAATVDQSKDNKAGLDIDTLKKSLVKNLTEEQQLLMRVVLGGDFTSATPQGIDQFKMPQNAAELLRHSNLKLFENKLQQITEDFPCQPDAALFGTFISIDEEVPPVLHSSLSGDADQRGQLCLHFTSTGSGAQLQAATASSTSPSPPPPAAKNATGGAAAQDKPPKTQQPWWTVKLADESPAWNLPTGKVFADFFTKGDRNFFPDISVLHHAERRRRPICLPYLTAGKCTKDCFFGHIRNAKSLPAADAKTIDDDAHDAVRSPRTGTTGLTGIAPSQWNPSPMTTASVGIDMRQPSRTAAASSGMSMRTSSNLAPSHNAELLKEYDYDLSQLLRNFQDTTMAYGSEFCPTEDIGSVLSVFGRHPNFEFFEIYQDERMAELEAQVLRGNHKSATSDPEGTDKMTGKDVKKGFSLPFPASIVTKIKQALVQPAGKVSQHSLTATGSRMLKDRLTHDLSFCLTEDYASVNSRCDFDKYPPIIYGSCLIRTIHYIVALRAAFPDERILISKFDFSDAYRRMAHDAAAAAQSILIVNHIAYLALRLSFGGAMNPAAWSCCSEMITDLSNELPLMEDWNPEEICSPDQHKVQAPIYLDDEPDQCAPAKPLSVHIPVTALGRSDCFIDDIIVVMIDRPEQILRHSSAAPLAILCAMRPNAGVEKEPIPRRDAMAGEQLVAEGSPFSAWSADKVDLRAKSKSKSNPSTDPSTEPRSTEPRPEPRSNIPRTDPSQAPIPYTASETSSDNRTVFQRVAGKVTSLVTKATSKTQFRWLRNQTYRLSDEDCCSDLRLWLLLLEKAAKGISLNGLTMRNPTMLEVSDSCPFGLGGFTSNGSAWRLQVSESSPIYGNCISNNVLEFLAMVITIWLTLIECKEQGLKDELILALGDNTSAIGWMTKTIPSFLPKATSFNLSHLTAAKRDTLIRATERGNARIIYDAQTESTAKTVDRVTRRWESFCRTNLAGLNPNLSGVSADETSFCLRAFFEIYQHSDFGSGGDISGGRQVPMAGKTIRSAGGALAASFLRNVGRSPLHCRRVDQEGREKLLPELNKLFAGMEADSPNVVRQKAITPKLLRHIIHDTDDAVLNEPKDHAAGLIVGAFFFAMRALKTPVPGITKRVRLGCIHFLSSKRERIRHDDPYLLSKAKFVTVVFEAEKNGDQFQARTQEKTKHPILCPVIRLGRAVQRVLLYIPDADEFTPLCATNSHKIKADSITSTFTLNLILDTCRKFGGESFFGFGPMDIGNKSLLSGAPMALFLMRHSSDRIMILGRWKSRAFLDYIRPQVFEWTSCILGDMISFDNFTDLLYRRITEPAETVEDTRGDGDPERQRNHFNKMPAFHLGDF
ncbi:hypothetical protein FRACYDRAFT_247237 [Fragilariopsis cylindrus CCMP1102]|uniref:C3H1-type domain-containing protein n=1 Tax=Fragilariopsis cylindrus CCMP1102 TaxID=635003 RepID=A0A1E7EWS1_9STRA|nr:hypothetical protein FRACYDRAFT_247237 [Fragilariopsis cylindrus CCMP1102]|eukprot:OEU10297.1 hypothetical protein FRACYDRAFT_247237 [Fragilariopsis cylindrus CCMP1102]